MIRTLALAIATSTSVAAAQPTPKQPLGDKDDAKLLMQSGVKLLEARDYLGALAIFKTAYQRFPSAKILLNIGTTLKLLKRDDEAANAYQRYLDAADSDPAKRADVEAALAELDRSVGQLEITVTPPDAELQINRGEWMPAARARRYRVPQGQFTVNARKESFASDAKSAHITSGEKAAIIIALTPLPDAPSTPTTTAAPTTSASTSDPSTIGGVTATALETRSRFGALAIAHIDVQYGGGAAFVGLTADATERLQVAAAGIIGPRYGAYAGASFALLAGAYRPFVAAGMPIFMSDGARFALRGAGGFEWLVNRHVAVVAELGFEYVMNPEPNIETSLFVPALGVTARL